MKFLYIILLIGCSKTEFKDSCQRVREFVDYYSSDTVYLRTDELFPWGSNNLICEPELKKIKDSELMGCRPQGYKRVRYKIGDKESKVKLFK